MAYDFRARSDATRIVNTEPSRTKQEFKASCDINNILKKYAKNGINPFMLTSDARFGDFSNVPSYHEAQNLVISAAERFAQLPAVLRKRFGNDPGQLLDFLSDDSNRAEAEELGLVNPRSTEASVEPVGSLTSAPASSAAGDTKTSP